MRVVHIGSSSGSSSDEGPVPPKPSAPALKPRRALGVQSSASSVEVASANAHGLKRKRDDEASAPKAAAPAGQQKIMMRKVVPGMFNKGKDAVSTTTQVSAAEQAAPGPPSPAKPLGPIRARSAVGWKRPQQEPDQPPPPAPPPAGAPPASTVPTLISAPESPPAPPKEPASEAISPPPVPQQNLLRAECSPFHSTISTSVR